MTNRPLRIGPIALTNTLTTNVVNPPTTTGGTNCGTPNTYIIIRHVRIVNKTAGAVTFSFWLGASAANAAGTEVLGQGFSVAANSAVDIFCYMRMDTTDFLVGGASAATSLSFEAEGEIGLV